MNKQVLRILEMEFLCKNWFQNTNLFIHRSLPPPHGSVVILILWGSRWVSCTLSLWRRSPLADTPSPTSEWRRHFKMLGFTRGLLPSGISAIWINRFVFWNQFLHKNSIFSTFYCMKYLLIAKWSFSNNFIAFVIHIFIINLFCSVPDHPGNYTSNSNQDPTCRSFPTSMRLASAAATGTFWKL